MAESRICSIEGCGKGGRICRGLCRSHHARWLRHGDPLAGRTALGVPFAFLRESLLSKTDDCIPWTFTKGINGYGIVEIDGKRHYAHRVVCEMAHGPAPTPEHEAAHSCGKGHEGCINWRHLRWATPAENEADKLLHGTDCRGEKQWMSKITEADVLEIRRLRGSMSQAEIGEIFGVSAPTVCNIHLRKTWAWLSDPVRAVIPQEAKHAAE